MENRDEVKGSTPVHQYGTFLWHKSKNIIISNTYDDPGVPRDAF
jgi:hypothetical protein